MSATSASASSRLLRRFTLAALVTNIGIVFTGGLVRVTGSGLGCPSWPTCDGETIVPRPGAAHATWQTAVEFGNRLLTFVVLAAVVGMFVQVRRTRPHGRSIDVLAWALPLGVALQAVVGGITVRMQLSPVTVAIHFLLSMVLVALAAVLYERVRTAAQPPVAPPSSGLRAATTALAAAAGAVLVLGTVVTGAGPHAGDPGTPRLGIDIRFAAIAHADAVWLLLGLTVALVAVTWRRGPLPLRRALRLLLLLEVVQGAIGYTQYALGIPEALVAAHILGATLLWATAVTCWARARPQPQPADLAAGGFVPAHEPRTT